MRRCSAVRPAELHRQRAEKRALRVHFLPVSSHSGEAGGDRIEMTAVA